MSQFANTLHILSKYCIACNCKAHPLCRSKMHLEKLFEGREMLEEEEAQLGGI